jgi:hypothetical protein
MKKKLSIKKVRVLQILKYTAYYGGDRDCQVVHHPEEDVLCCNPGAPKPMICWFVSGY